MAEKFLLEMAETIKASIPGNNIQIEDQENKAVISGDMECGIKGINVSIECSTSTIKIKGAREYKYPITEASKDIFQQEMIKKYRGSLISSILVILAGVLVGFTSTHGKWINVFFVVTHCIFVAIIFYDNRSRQQSPKVIGMTIWMIPVITLLYNGIARLVNTGAGMENLFMAFMYYGTGLLFMVIGNYLPKVKQNNTIGIRVIWTLQDEENWNATHRFSGKL